MVRLLLISFSFLFVNTVIAQDSLYLNIDRVISQAKSDNIEMKRSMLMTQIAEAEYQKSKEWWLPDLFVGTTLHHLDGWVMNGDGRIFEDVDRQNRWYGGEVNFNWDFAKGIFESKARKLEAEGAGLLSGIQSEQSALSAIAAYYDLLLASSKQNIYQDLIASKESLIVQLTSQVEAGLRLESELLLAKSNHHRLQLHLLKTRQVFQNAEAEVLKSLNIVNSDYAITGDILDLEMIEIIDLETITEDKGPHPMIVAGQLKLEAAQKSMDAVNKSLFLPKAGLRYSYGPFGTEYAETATTRGLNGWIGWKLPLGQIFMGGDSQLATAKSEMASLEIAEQNLFISRDISNYKAQLRDTKEVLELSKAGSSFALEAMGQAEERQALGLGSTYEILQAQEEYLQSRMLYFEAVAAYNLPQYRLLVSLGRRL